MAPPNAVLLSFRVRGHSIGSSVFRILFEVYVACELNIFGFKPEEVESFVRAISGFSVI